MPFFEVSNFVEQKYIQSLGFQSFVAPETGNNIVRNPEIYAASFSAVSRLGMVTPADACVGATQRRRK